MSNIKQSATSQSTETEIFYARRHTVIIIIIAALLIIAGLVAVSVTGTGSGMLGLGIFFIVITIIRYNMGYVIFGKDYLAIKVAPARSRVSILFNEITSIIQTDKKITIFYKINGQPNASEKNIKIIPKAMEKDEFLKLNQTLYKHLAAKISKQ